MEKALVMSAIKATNISDDPQSNSISNISDKDDHLTDIETHNHLTNTTT